MYLHTRRHTHNAKGTIKMTAFGTTNTATQILIMCQSYKVQCFKVNKSKGIDYFYLLELTFNISKQNERKQWYITDIFTLKANIKSLFQCFDR